MCEDRENYVPDIYDFYRVLAFRYWSRGRDNLSLEYAAIATAIMEPIETETGWVNYERKPKQHRSEVLLAESAFKHSGLR